MLTYTLLLRRSFVAFVAIVALTLATPAWANQQDRGAGAPMADRLPEDVILYVGWVGSDRIAELWDGTHTQALVQASNFEDFFTRYIPEALDKVAEKEPDAAQAIGLAKELLPLFIKRPSAFALGGMNFAGGPPMPKLIFAIDAGDEAEALEQRMRQIMRQAGQQPMEMFISRKNGIVRFGVGYNLDELDRLAEGNGNSLAASESFRASMSALNGSPTSAFFLDFARLVEMGEEAAQMFAPPEAQEKVKQIIDLLGLRGLKQLAATSGFSGKSYETQAFLSYTGREGILSLMPTGPLDAQTMAAIPSGSTMVVAEQFDFAAMVSLMREVIVQLEPEMEGHIAQAMAMVNEAAGVNVETDVLGQLGATWAFYVNPRIGNGAFSTMMVNRPRDAAKLDTALTSTSRNLLAMINQHLSEETEGAVTLPGRSLEVSGQTLHILNTPLIAPTWSVNREAGLLQIAFYPQSILSAGALKAEPFVQSGAWRTLQQQLGGEREMVAMSFYDLPSFTPDSYPLILMFSQMGFGGADLVSDYLGTEPPVMVLPPLATVLEHVEPSGAVAWVTAEGLHFRALEPFPMSSMLTVDVQSMALQAIFSSMGTSVGAAREAAEQADRARAMAEEARQRAEEAEREDR